LIRTVAVAQLSSRGLVGVAPLRALSSGSSSYVDVRDTAEGRRRRANFWEKWGALSQQEFWQDVGFGHDRAKDNERLETLRANSEAGRTRRKLGRPSGEPAEDWRVSMDADEYFDATDALEHLDMEGIDEVSDASHLADLSGAGSGSGEFLSGLEMDTRAGVERSLRARQALMQSGAVAPGRRAELLALLEDLGPDGLQEPPKLPFEDFSAKRDGSNLLQEDLSRSLLTTRCFMDAVKLREAGALPDGAYFAYLLKTRRVSRVSAKGKVMSFSSLVVVGNGQGTAGLGLGKDAEIGNALYKATIDARKNLVHVSRFDNRTLFHAIDDRFARSKLVLRLRRPGSGTRCSWTVWKILSAFGITDVSCKIHGSRNPITVSRGLVNALRRMSSAQDVAERRGLRVLDLDPTEIQVPGY